MILELILSPIFSLFDGLLDLLPSMPDMPSWIDSVVDVISGGLYIFPKPVWVLTIGSISFWTFGQFVWAFIEWVYKKIPGVN